MRPKPAVTALAQTKSDPKTAVCRVSGYNLGCDKSLDLSGDIQAKYEQVKKR